MKVFVVDDSAVIRQRIKRMLADEPKFKIVGEAADAHEATEAILKLKNRTRCSSTFTCSTGAVLTCWSG